MKKLGIVAISILGLASWSLAVSGSVWLSSNTATVDTNKALCQTVFASSWPRGVVHNVCVNTGTAGTYTVYNSSGSGVNKMAAIDTAAKGCQIYDVVMSSGITYTNSATADVTISYSCY